MRIQNERQDYGGQDKHKLAFPRFYSILDDYQLFDMSGTL